MYLTYNRTLPGTPFWTPRGSLNVKYMREAVTSGAISTLQASNYHETYATYKLIPNYVYSHYRTHLHYMFPYHPLCLETLFLPCRQGWAAATYSAGLKITNEHISCRVWCACRVETPTCDGWQRSDNMVTMTSSNEMMFSLICTWINGSVNNGEDGDLRRHRAHYDVTLVVACCLRRALLIVVGIPAVGCMTADSYHNEEIWDCCNWQWGEGGPLLNTTITYTLILIIDKWLTRARNKHPPPNTRAYTKGCHDSTGKMVCVVTYLNKK